MSHIAPPALTNNAPPAAPAGRSLTIGGALLALLCWSYWPVLTRLWSDWQHDANYSAGQLVLPVALLLLFREWNLWSALPRRPDWLAGLALLALAQLIRLFGFVFLYESAERASFVVTLAGLVLLVCGRIVAWRARWLLAFLLLMIPLPGRLHNLIAGPLQDVSTAGAMLVLDVLGVVAARRGNVIYLNDDFPIGVAEACNGLRMLTAFLIIAAVLAFLVRRPTWQRVVLVVSSVPIAIFCNVVRISATALVLLWVNRSLGSAFFHDLAGLAMMPLAIFLLIGELWIMKRLVVPDSPSPRTAG
jgi:exosortase